MTVTILKGDCRQVLATLPDESVHCVVTSPPYFRLRDYGVAGQIGLELSPEAFVDELVAVFRAVRRVLRTDGTLWLNLGDTYASAWPCSRRNIIGSGSLLNGKREARPPRMGGDLKEKDLIGIPWLVAFAMRRDGWYLRQDIIWSKPNPMPESVTDRCTKAHEYLFLLTKNERYFYDANAISEPSCRGYAGSEFDKDKTAQHLNGRMSKGERPQARRARELAEKAGLTDAHIAAIRAAGATDAGKAQTTQAGFGKNTDEVIRLAAEAKTALGGYYREFLIADNRNKRSVWEVPTAPFTEAHFATFPPDLIEPCIMAGCPKGGTVLDPFGGAGTTGLVADRLGRNAILIELNPEYADMAERRIKNDAGMFAEIQ